MRKILVLDRITIAPEAGGRVAVRLRKCIADSDGALVHAGDYFSYDIEPGQTHGDVDETLAVQESISGYEWSEGVKARVMSLCTVEHTPEVVAAHKAAKEKRRAEEAARQAAAEAERAKAQGHSAAVPIPGLGGVPT